ncbi:MAG: diguanylate cyclase [Oceanospirillaceae bacterium]|nr:diguanylate cyclase [Oceanospirillaceae bacterium]
MSKLLIIEDSVMMQKVIKHVAEAELDCMFDIAATKQEAERLISCNEYFLALADLHLPDAPNGEIVDSLLDEGIATIVLTASMDDAKKQQMLDKGVLDYILKENRDSYFHAIKLANQIHYNKNVTVLLADDSALLRRHIRRHLEQMLFNVQEAVNGIEALNAIKENPEIGLLITDFNMPEMDGIELIRNIRKTRTRDIFPIIGLSSSNDPTLSAQFIKNGANDFLITPFIHEEFQWRILKTMEEIKLIQKITDSANRDYLTMLHNRRYFFTQAKKLHEQAKSAHSSLNIALLDIDHFKKINDEYGHDAGDAILIQLSKQLKHAFSEYTVARYGGEEFIVIFDAINLDKTMQILESFRQKIASTKYRTTNKTLSFTLSIGVATLTDDSLEGLIKKADLALYEAKEQGRNQVVSTCIHFSTPKKLSNEVLLPA